ncbi:DedA family protein [Aquitalea palustris]|uniref:DedA family protein n=1 Tax=Aquitalea palustris TaxID=2480983 RepID=A0A454JF98_9NEIS|nr:VTT domain-containing protein [Aquitalea palustris]RMC94239.1 DedA family protein [Aquitalea palustris]
MQAVWLALGGLVVSAFTSSTILPGNSEVVLAAFLYKWPDWLWPALLLATVANSAGSATSLWLGRVAPKKEVSPRIQRWFERYGPAVLLLSWVPLIGDALPLAAGWLRLPWLPSLLWLTVGKAARYLVLAWGVLAALHA